MASSLDWLTTRSCLIQPRAWAGFVLEPLMWPDRLEETARGGRKARTRIRTIGSMWMATVHILAKANMLLQTIAELVRDQPRLRPL